jgi:hemerythrin-like domain-containing protein
MIEHRLIERMLAVVEDALSKIQVTAQADPALIDAVVDFVRVYADRTHHGKEEDILFRALSQKALSAEDQRMMDELIAEHVFGRATTRALVEANERYRRGDGRALADLVYQLQILAGFYPKHIARAGMQCARVIMPGRLAALCPGIPARGEPTDLAQARTAAILGHIL